MKSIEELELQGKRVFIRVDLNVPLDHGKVADATRIEACLPTIRYACEHGAKVVLASHLGRPKGQVQVGLSLKPVAAELERRLGCKVAMLEDCVGTKVAERVSALSQGEVALLENLRFHPEEEKNDPGFAAQLASLCDVYINDAFGAAHRAHASTEGIVAKVPSAAAGLLMLAEVEALTSLIDSPARPFITVLGGAKVSDKIGLIGNLLDKVSTLLIGGAMAYTFLKAMGVEVGTSRVEEDKLDLAAELLSRARAAGVSVELPSDHVAAAEFSETAKPVSVASADIPSPLMGLDIGPATRTRYTAALARAATVLWNGPMGVFEWEAFSEGTLSIAHAVADCPGHSVVGGGDSVAALAKSGRTADIDHVSTGGGASLELLEGKLLPGIAALEAGDK